MARKRKSHTAAFNAQVALAALKGTRRSGNLPERRQDLDWRARGLDLNDQGPDAIGVPSTGLSLGWMLASRANLRFTRLNGDNAKALEKPEQAEFAGQDDLQKCSEGTFVFCPNNGVRLTWTWLGAMKNSCEDSDRVGLWS